MITNVKPTVFQGEKNTHTHTHTHTHTQQLVSNHGVTTLKNTAVQKTNAIW
jgi:hypothetical protein